MDKKTNGAWVIHHTHKLNQVTNSTQFDNIVLAGKAGLLLSALSESTDESTLSASKVKIIAKANGISPAVELPTLLSALKQNQLIDTSDSGDVQTLGLTTAAVLSHTSDIFNSSDPDPIEKASITLSELASATPAKSEKLTEYLGDTYQLSANEAKSVLKQSEEMGFVDAESLTDDSSLYFNGNLFKRDNALKVSRVLDSLTQTDRVNVLTLDEMFSNTPCIAYQDAVHILGEPLMQKLHAIGMFDITSISNEAEDVAFLTKPSAFNKYGDALVDDALDLAKLFVTALSYGMTHSSSNRGRITMLPALMGKLLRGQWIGPATAIGQDYKVLELKRVIETRRVGIDRFEMRLLKDDVGELALQAIIQGDISEMSVPMLHGARVSRYRRPEENRENRRRKQTEPSRKQTLDMLRTLRTGESL